MNDGTKDISPSSEKAATLKEVSPPRVDRTSLNSANMVGTWDLYDYEVAGISVRQTNINNLARVTYQFYSNGRLNYWENGLQYSGEWSLNGTLVTTTIYNVGSFQSTVTYFDGSTITVAISELAPTGYYVDAFYTYTRRN